MFYTVIAESGLYGSRLCFTHELQVLVYMEVDWYIN